MFTRRSDKQTRTGGPCPIGLTKGATRGPVPISAMFPRNGRMSMILPSVAPPPSRLGVGELDPLPVSIKELDIDGFFEAHRLPELEGAPCGPYC